MPLRATACNYTHGCDTVDLCTYLHADVVVLYSGLGEHPCQEAVARHDGPIQCTAVGKAVVVVETHARCVDHTVLFMARF